MVCVLKHLNFLVRRYVQAMNRAAVIQICGLTDSIKTVFFYLMANNNDYYKMVTIILVVLIKIICSRIKSRLYSSVKSDFFSQRYFDILLLTFFYLSLLNLLLKPTSGKKLVGQMEFPVLTNSHSLYK